MTRHKTETHQRVSDSPASLPLVQSVPMDSEQLCKSGIASSSQAMSVDTHRDSESPTRAWSEAVSLRIDKIPSAGILERFEKCSAVTARPAIEQALIPSFPERGEKRQMPDAIVSAHIRKRGVTCSPSCSAAFTQPVSAPAAPSVPHTRAVALTSSQMNRCHR